MNNIEKINEIRDLFVDEYSYHKVKNDNDYQAWFDVLKEIYYEVDSQMLSR